MRFSKTNRPVGLWVSMAAILAGLLMAVPLTSAVSVTPPFNSSWTSNSGGIGCNGGNTWDDSPGTSSGYIYEYAKSWNDGYPGCGIFGPWSSSKDLYSGLHGASFLWTKASGYYVFDSYWTIAFRITANVTGGSGCIGGSPATYWSLTTYENLYDSNTGSSLSSTNWYTTVASGSLTGCPATYSQTFAAQQYISYALNGPYMTQGDTYIPRAGLWLHTTGSSSQSSNSDATVDVYSYSGGQQNYAELDSFYCN
jgi:hypothetical protein